MPASIIRRAATALVATLLGLAVAEAALRAFGFEFAMRPESVDFGGPTRATVHSSYVQYPDVFWVYHGYDENLARLRASQPRIVFMGDSCTQLCRYDEAFASRVAADSNGRPPHTETSASSDGRAGKAGCNLNGT